MPNTTKAIVAVLGAVVVAVHELLDQGPWTIAKTLMVALAGLGAVTVYVVPNLDPNNGIGTFAKAFVAWVTAGVETAIPFLDDSVVTGSEWLLIAMAVMTAAGVPLLRNGPKVATRGTDGAYNISSFDS